MKKVILYIAMSLDGYIADKNGKVDWLGGDNSDTKNIGSYPDFIQNIDTVILGYKTYHQIVTELSPDNWVYADKKTYVITHNKLESSKDIIFTDENISSLINHLKKQNGKNIWICGGASIVNQLIVSNLIDTFYITIIPTLLGNGLRLFDNYKEEFKLNFVSSQNYNGIVDLVYEKRK